MALLSLLSLPKSSQQWERGTTTVIFIVGKAVEHIFSNVVLILFYYYVMYMDENQSCFLQLSVIKASETIGYRTNFGQPLLIQ